MKKIGLAFLLGVILLLVACNDSGKEKEQDLQGADEEGIGFSLSGESVEEAQNVPEEEKKDILNAFDLYITKFNEKDLDGYMDMIAEETESFDKQEERAYTASFFKENDLKLTPSEVTIVKYDEKEAQVFTRTAHKQKQLSTGLETNQFARQVILFQKKDGEWKVGSVHSIPENPIQK